jgi:hypothetical protein
MAKRVPKSTTTSAKQTAATRRTKKTKTATKKAPVKKTTKTSGKAATPKKSAKTTKKVPPNKPTVISGKKVTTKKGPVKKTTKTTLAAVAKYKAEQAEKVAALEAKRKGSRKKTLKREYYVLSEKAPSSEFSEMGEKVRLGEAKWVYYAIDDDIGYHHYEKLK